MYAANKRGCGQGRIHGIFVDDTFLSVNNFCGDKIFVMYRTVSERENEKIISRKVFFSSVISNVVGC